MVSTEKDPTSVVPVKMTIIIGIVGFYLVAQQAEETAYPASVLGPLFRLWIWLYYVFVSGFVLTVNSRSDPTLQINSNPEPYLQYSHLGSGTDFTVSVGSGVVLIFDLKILNLLLLN